MVLRKLMTHFCELFFLGLTLTTCSQPAYNFVENQTEELWGQKVNFDSEATTNESKVVLVRKGSIISLRLQKNGKLVEPLNIKYAFPPSIRVLTAKTLNIFDSPRNQLALELAYNNTGRGVSENRKLIITGIGGGEFRVLADVELGTSYTDNMTNFGYSYKYNYEIKAGPNPILELSIAELNVSAKTAQLPDKIIYRWDNIQFVKAAPPPPDDRAR